MIKNSQNKDIIPFNKKELNSDILYFLNNILCNVYIFLFS